MEGGMDKGDLPNFNVVFLSDGKPSDSFRVVSGSTVGREASERRRVEILTELATPLQSKFSLYCMGVGAKQSDFTSLASMVDTVKQAGGTGQFVHAGLSAVNMSSSFSAISTAITSVRTDLLGTSHGNDTPTNNVKKDFTMRETGKTYYVAFSLPK
jgi:hypothetical protein